MQILKQSFKILPGIIAIDYFQKKKTNKQFVIQAKENAKINFLDLEPNTFQQKILLHNLSVFESISINDDKSEFIYLPIKNCQGHNSISHGGFTGCLIEYAARQMQNKFNDSIITDFYLRYTKPIKINNKYKLVINKIENNYLDFKIVGLDSQPLYAKGYIKFSD